MWVLVWVLAWVLALAALLAQALAALWVRAMEWEPLTERQTAPRLGCWKDFPLEQQRGFQWEFS